MKIIVPIKIIKIKIIKCSYKDIWYNKFIGNIIEVYDSSDNFYHLSNSSKNNYLKFPLSFHFSISKDDCILYNFRKEKLERILAEQYPITTRTNKKHRNYEN